MKIEISDSIISDLKDLLTQLDNAHKEISHDTIGVFYHDTLDSFSNSSDPIELNTIDISTLILGAKLKAVLKL